MEKRIEKQVIYCLNLPNCGGDRRRYFHATESLVNKIKSKIDEISGDEKHRVVFPYYSGTEVYYNPKWEDSLEFKSKNREAALLTAKSMGFLGLFPKLRR